MLELTNSLSLSFPPSFNPLLVHHIFLLLLSGSTGSSFLIPFSLRFLLENQFLVRACVGEPISSSVSPTNLEGVNLEKTMRRVVTECFYEALHSLGYYNIKTEGKTSEWRRRNFHLHTYPWGKRGIKLSLHKDV